MSSLDGQERCDTSYNWTYPEETRCFLPAGHAGNHEAKWPMNNPALSSEQNRAHGSLQGTVVFGPAAREEPLAHEDVSFYVKTKGGYPLRSSKSEALSEAAREEPLEATIERVAKAITMQQTGDPQRIGEFRIIARVAIEASRR